MPIPPMHPVEQPALPALMLISFSLGSLTFLFVDVATSRFAVLVMALSFTVFLISFVLYLLAWVLREHELWREGRRETAEQAGLRRAWPDRRSAGADTETG